MTRIATLPRGRTIVQGNAPTLEFQVLWQNLARAIESDGTDISVLQSQVAALEAPFTRRTVTATGNLLVTDVLVLANANSGAITLTLPAVATSDGARIIVKKIDASANAVTVDGNGAETIDGAANQALAAQYDAVTVWCDGATWHIV